MTEHVQFGSFRDALRAAPDRYLYIYVAESLSEGWLGARPLPATEP
jgi:hypothetical protein